MTPEQKDDKPAGPARLFRTLIAILNERNLNAVHVMTLIVAAIEASANPDQYLWAVILGCGYILAALIAWLDK